MEERMIELTDFETQELLETGYTTHGDYVVTLDSDDEYRLYKITDEYEAIKLAR